VAESATLELLARGGLAQTLAELQRSFHFAPPVAVTVEGHDALALVGQWRDELLGRRWPGAVGASGAQWPAPLPHHVLLVVGARDFFPYVIEYRRGADETWASTPHASPDPLARFEFYAVDFAAAMREEMFEFRANDVQWRDATSLMVQRLLPRAAPAPQVQTAAGSAPWRQ
ncbi:MAG TPA: hypothetical protein PKC18_14470, partial [Lacipirellulaceae bacterium]|nr:hypothetical protein [Lacipirellulaceae bacterium]